jgi:hypothetical protein
LLSVAASVLLLGTACEMTRDGSPLMCSVLSLVSALFYLAEPS